MNENKKKKVQAVTDIQTANLSHPLFSGIFSFNEDHSYGNHNNDQDQAKCTPHDQHLNCNIEDGVVI